MPFDDLDLEFEDEEESKKKKNDAVQQDVDLEFHTPEAAKPRPHPQVPPVNANVASNAGPAPVSKPVSKPPGEVRKIEEARAQNPVPGQVIPVRRAPQAPVASAPMTDGSGALKEQPVYDLESQQVVELQEQMRKVQIESEIKVAVAEFKMEYLSEMLSDIKLLEHQIGHLLVRINAKHPDMKNEVLMIKKILADFTTKKRK
jgi:hypothetical protein